jgi:hypothetical protein
MWTGMFHLFIGNAFIGALEAALISQFFAVPKAKAALLLIPANYFSAWVGGYFLRSAIINSLHLDLNNGWRWFWIMVGLTYLLTLILEWPFIAVCFWRTGKWLSGSIRACLLCQTASYLFLFGSYWMVSGTSLFTKLHVTAPAELGLPEQVVVYFISGPDGNVYRRPLAGGAPVQICELHSTNANDRLLVRPNRAHETRWDLVALLEHDGTRKPKLVEVLTNKLWIASLDERQSQTDLSQYEGTWFNFGRVPTLANAENSRWKFRTGFWPFEGIVEENDVTGVKQRFSFETPFGAWAIRNAVHLPSDKVLFQLGDDQICVLDPQSRRVTLLWHGRGPVPVIETSEETSEAVPPEKPRQVQTP